MMMRLRGVLALWARSLMLFLEAFRLAPVWRATCPDVGGGRVSLPQRVPQAELLTDWNNDYAAFLVTLTRRLQDAKNDEERREIIAGLSKAL